MKIKNIIQITGISLTLLPIQPSPHLCSHKKKIEDEKNLFLKRNFVYSNLCCFPTQWKISLRSRKKCTVNYFQRGGGLLKIIGFRKGTCNLQFTLPDQRHSNLVISSSWYNNISKLLGWHTELFIRRLHEVYVVMQYLI